MPRRVFQGLLPERPTPEWCVEAYLLQRTQFESFAERKVRRRELTEDGNVEISGPRRSRAKGAASGWRGSRITGEGRGPSSAVTA